MKKVAIIGAGPSGFYIAQALLKAIKQVQISFYERSQQPYGLAQYGVAPDHFGTKSVTRQFSRVLASSNVSIEYGREIAGEQALQALQEDHDAIVLACGLHSDRTFPISGGHLAHIYGAGTLARHWNNHPDYSLLKPVLGKTCCVFGNGNVAIDIIRLLMMSESDFNHRNYPALLANQNVERIHVIGRNPLELAKFDSSLVAELAHRQNVSFQMSDTDLWAPKTDNGVVKELSHLLSLERPSAKKQVIFHSGWQPEAFTGRASVNSIELKRSGAEQTKFLGCDSVVTAIGFVHDALFERESLLQKAEDLPNGILGRGLFATGWFWKGAQGKIADNRKDAQLVSKSIVEWLGK